MNPKVVFMTHVDQKGKLIEGKEIFECPHCGGEAFIKNETVTPSGTQHLEYECTDCLDNWKEVY